MKSPLIGKRVSGGVVVDVAYQQNNDLPNDGFIPNGAFKLLVMRDDGSMYVVTNARNVTVIKRTRKRVK